MELQFLNEMKNPCVNLFSIHWDLELAPIQFLF